MNNPALLTLAEYLKTVDPDGKRHPDHAYDHDLSQLNTEYSTPKSSFDKLLRRIKIRGVTFEFYIRDDKPFGTVIGVFNEDGKMVGATQDEWGTMLIRVAKEYRGFGLGPILGKIARTIEPMKPSGGFTYAGQKNFVKVYREFVRDALKNGTYTELVRSGKMTAERAKEIIASASLNLRAKEPTGDVSSKPQDWLLYVGGYGDFILYDRKLKDVIDDANPYWIERMVKGLVLVREPKDGFGILVQFGGDTPRTKSLMLNCAMSFCRNEGIRFFVDPEDREFVDARYGTVSEAIDRSLGHERYEVTPTEALPDMDEFAPVEAHYRKSFDQYDEFKNHMMELAYGKFQKS